MNAFLLPFIAYCSDRLSKPVWLSLASLLIASCTSVAPTPVENSQWSLHQNQLRQLDSWQLRGRVNVRYHDESHTPRIRWQQQDTEYTIRLWGTFNAGNTIIVGRPGFVTLEQGGTVLSASSPENLILQQLGYEMPVSYLEYWIRGLPAPTSSADLTFSESGRLEQMVQDGWTINYTDPRQYGDLTLPRRVEVTRPRDDVRLRFVGLNWTLPEIN